jgi:SWI/SNF-related matrix-associated actin-dependent regulator of chromatin subfamily A3
MVAHRIRNRNSKLFRDVCELQANYYWCLTGTPIQNSLEDFSTLLTFINIVPFQHHEYFRMYISEPIKKGQVRGLQLLKKVVAATCLRRTKADHASLLQLPQKLERIERVDMSVEDRKIYEFFKKFSLLNAVDTATSKKFSSTNILILISMLRLICDHGEALLPEFARKTWRDRDLSLLTMYMLDSGVEKCISCDHELTRSPSVPSSFSGAPSQSALVSCLSPEYPPSPKLQTLLCNIKEKQKATVGEARPSKW